MGNQISTAMTKEQSNLAKELDRRLQERALLNRENSYRSGLKTEDLNKMIQTPTRIHQHMIQRAQFYTGDA